MSHQLIPLQEKGKSVDLEENIKVNDDTAAKKIFQHAVYCLSHPTTWHDSAGTLSATFSIDGKQKEQSLEPGDHIRINIPGPGLKEGEGEDWVRVETIETDFDKDYDESFGMLLLVCPNPHTEGDAIAHFFAAGASSTFLVMRKAGTVTAHYKGRNESPNTDELALTDKVRNVVVAGGALAGVSELQWRALLKGLLDGNDKSGFNAH